MTTPTIFLRRCCFLFLISCDYLRDVWPFCQPDQFYTASRRRNLNNLYGATDSVISSASSSSTIGKSTNSNDNLSSNDGLSVMDAESAAIPLDETFSRNPYKKFIRPLFTAGLTSKTKSATHDEALEANGGVWKSFLIGRSWYLTSGHIPDIVRQLTKAEARGRLENDPPQYIINLIGNDSLVAVKDLQADDSYFKAKKVLVDALSTQNVLNGKMNGIYKELDQLAAHWDAVADENRTTLFLKDVSDLSYKVIINAIFGEDAISKQDMETLRKCTAQVGKGMIGLPIKTPILRKLPFFRRYSRALEARAVMRSQIEEKIALKRAQLKRSNIDPTVKFKSSGMLDDFILQMDSSSVGFPEEKVIDFCVDNTLLSIFAGFDTTASLMSNIMLILHSDSNARDLVRDELASFNITSIPKKQIEVLDSLPAFKSVFMEAYRHRPAVVNTFRKTKYPVVVGNVRIPTNTTIVLSNAYGSLSEKLYESPQKVCPLRYYSKDFGIQTVSGNGNNNNKMEPPPNIFGYGKHLCPGQYLAQIEIALVAKYFLTNYEYDLVEGQDLRPWIFNAPRSGLMMKLRKRENNF